MKKMAMIVTAAALMMTMCACASGNQTTTSESSRTSAPASTASVSGTDSTVSTESTETASSLKASLEEVKKEITMPADTSDFTAAKMKRTFGIEESMMDDFAGLYCTDGLRQDQIVYVKAKDEASAAEIEKKLQDNWQSKYNVIKNYSPEQVAIIESAKVEKNGLYVSLVISADADKIKEIFQKGIK